MFSFIAQLSTFKKIIILMLAINTATVITTRIGHDASRVNGNTGVLPTLSINPTKTKVTDITPQSVVTIPDENVEDVPVAAADETAVPEPTIPVSPEETVDTTEPNTLVGGSGSGAIANRTSTKSTSHRSTKTTSKKSFGKTKSSTTTPAPASSATAVSGATTVSPATTTVAPAATSMISGQNITFEAEAAQHNVQVVSEGKAYSSGGTVLGYFGEQGQYVTFTVTVPSDGQYATSIRYAAADGDNAQNPLPRTMFINNAQTGIVNFPRTSEQLDNWNTLTTKDLGNLSLKAGANTITFRIDSPGYNYWDVDYLTVAGASDAGGTIKPDPTPVEVPPTIAAAMQISAPAAAPTISAPSTVLNNYATRKCTAGSIPGSPIYLSAGEDFGAAVNALNSGQTLVVRAGNYSANVDLGAKSNITICADPAGGRPVLTGGIAFRGASNVHIEGLELVGNQSYEAGINFSWGSTGMSAWDNYVHGFTQCGVCAAAASGKLDIRYNRVWDNSHTSCYGGSGISTWAFSNANSGNDENGYNTYIIGNISWDNHQDVASSCIGAGDVTDGNCIIIDAMNGSQGGLGGSTDQFAGRFLIANNVCADTGGRCVNVFASQRVDVYNNTCYHSVKSAALSGAGEIQVVYSDDVRVSNNIAISGNYGVPYNEYSASNVSFSNNIWFGSGAAVRGSGDQVVDPQLISPQDNAGNGDWRPQAGSPAINAGTSIGVVTIDAAGKPRAATPSIGAFEP